MYGQAIGVCLNKWSYWMKAYVECRKQFVAETEAHLKTARELDKLKQEMKPHETKTETAELKPQPNIFESVMKDKMIKARRYFGPPCEVCGEPSVFILYDKIRIDDPVFNSSPVKEFGQGMCHYYCRKHFNQTNS